MKINPLTSAISIFLVLISTTLSYGQKIISIENEYVMVDISSRGGEIQRIESKQTGRQYIWNGSQEIWKNRAPLMFPVVVKFKDNEYTYKGQSYTMPLMGLLKDSQVEIEKTSESSASFIYKSSPKTKKIYPFDFILTIAYRLDKNELVHEFQLENIGDELMYYDLGGHPIIPLSSEENKTREDYQYTFSEPVTIMRYPIVKGLKQTTPVAFLSNEKFINLSDNRIPDSGGMLLTDFPQTTLVGVAEKGKKPFIEVQLGDFKNVNLWAPSDKPLLAIEPILGHHDGQQSPKAIEDKPQVSTIKPNEKKIYRFSLFLY